MTPHAAHGSISSESRFMGGTANTWMRLGAIAGVLGMAAAALMVFMDMQNAKAFFNRSYLTAYVFVLSICLGGLFFVMLNHAVRAGWNIVVRRVGEAVAGNLMWLWVLFIPIWIGLRNGQLYPWTDPAVAGSFPHSKQVFLSEGFWLIRAGVCFLVWALLARYFIRNSVAQDANPDVAFTRRMQSFCYPALLLYALTQSMASIDWVMSLSPKWFSTMFPVYFFAASACGFFATQILLVFSLQRTGRLNEVSVEHYQDMGKLLFAFGIVFWAYIAFSQYMLIWYADLPEETPWYITRYLGGWGTVSLLLLFGHFAAPFVGLISRHPKRLKVLLAVGAAWMLLMHYADMTWIVKPIVPEEMLASATSFVALSNAVSDRAIGFDFSLLDIALTVGMLGLFVAGTAYRLGKSSLVPVNDPRLHESLAFENI